MDDVSVSGEGMDAAATTAAGGQRTVYHGGAIYQIRVQNLLGRCEEASLTADYFGWKRLLDRLRLEVAWKLDPEKEKADLDEKLQRVLQALRGYAQAASQLETGGRKAQAAFEQAGGVAYTELLEYEGSIRGYLGKYGYLGPEKREFDVTEGL